MNAQEILAQIDHAITEIDLLLHEWQEGLDMMSFLGVNATFELWTNDIPPRLVTKDVLAQAAGKELRVMHHVDGAWTKVGTATVDVNGLLTARIEKDVPELRKGLRNAYSIRETEMWKPLPSEKAFDHVHPKLGDGVPFWTDVIKKNVDEAIKNLENHSFFKKEQD